MKKTIAKKSKAVSKSLVGASLAGLAATAYFFLGPDGKKHQKYAKAWAIKMKGDVVEKLEQAREVSEPVYKDIIDTVAKKHKTVVKSGQAEIMELAQDLKKHWQTISGMTGSPKAVVVKKVAPVVKKKVALKKAVAKKVTVAPKKVLKKKK